MIIEAVLTLTVLIELYIILVLRSEIAYLRDRLLSEIKEQTLLKSKYQRARMPIEMTEITNEQAN